MALDPRACGDSRYCGDCISIDRSQMSVSFSVSLQLHVFRTDPSRAHSSAARQLSVRLRRSRSNTITTWITKYSLGSRGLLNYRYIECRSFSLRRRRESLITNKFVSGFWFDQRVFRDPRERRRRTRRRVGRGRAPASRGGRSTVNRAMRSGPAPCRLRGAAFALRPGRGPPFSCGRGQCPRPGRGSPIRSGLKSDVKMHMIQTP